MELRIAINKIRHSLGMSKAAFGKSVGLTGQYISMLESGKNKKISEPVIKQICSTHGISRDFLISGTINENYLYEIQSTVSLNRNTVTAAAISKNLNIPELFIQAIIDGEVSPSDEFFKRFMKEGIGVEPHGRLKDDVQERVTKTIKAREVADAAIPRSELISIEEYDKVKDERDDAYEKLEKLEKMVAMLQGKVDVLTDIVGSAMKQK